jgi:hypothetical protein
MMRKAQVNPLIPEPEKNEHELKMTPQKTEPKINPGN